MLTSAIIKGVKTGFPLRIEASEVKVSNVDFNAEFISRMIGKLQWPAVCQAADNVGHLGELPQEVPENFESNEPFLKQAHHVLLEVEVQEGFLVCPETGRKFPVNNGIPNMLLNEDEV
jgi:multifunctional methyltransferase subunit TRM112